MTKSEFLKVFENPRASYRVVYRDKYTRDILKGLLLDGIQLGVDGNEFLFVDNFYKRIRLEDVIEVHEITNDSMEG